MTGADLERLPLRGWIIGRADGLFEHLPEFEPGAIEADMAMVRDDDLESYDAVAWERGSRSPWWLVAGVATVLGEHELSAAWWDGRPARMLETPTDYVAAHGAGFVVLDWTADLNSVLGGATAVECATLALYERLRTTLIQQALPRGLAITTAPAGLQKVAA
jgi:hypothetical protein